MCVLRALFLAALMAILSAAQGGPERERVSAREEVSTPDAGSCIDPNGCAQANAGVRIDDNG